MHIKDRMSLRRALHLHGERAAELRRLERYIVRRAIDLDLTGDLSPDNPVWAPIREEIEREDAQKRAARFEGFVQSPGYAPGDRHQWPI